MTASEKVSQPFFLCGTYNLCQKLRGPLSY